MCDAGYPNAEGFLAPYRGERYHLSEWRGRGNPPTTPREFFNMKHSSARNVIERAFGMLKGRWAILRGKSFYPVQIQCRTIIACCLLHNLIMREMGEALNVEEGDEGEPGSSSIGNGENIQFIESSDEWSMFRDNLASRMFSEWENRGRNFS